MKPSKILRVLKTATKLKENTRHSWTPSGRRESVAEHSWRLSMFAYFMKDEFPEFDIDNWRIWKIAIKLAPKLLPSLLNSP